MKRKKNPVDRTLPDKYRDGPKKPIKQPRSTWDDENLDKAYDEWMEMRRLSDSDGEEE